MTEPAQAVDRPHLSPSLLWNAEHQAALAKELEEAQLPKARAFWIEHRAYVLSSIVAAAGFLEAFINEIYQDVEDRGLGLLYPADWLDQVTKPLKEETQLQMRGYWAASRGRSTRTLEKYERLAEWCGGKLSEPVRANARLLVRVRNAILHFRPRDHYRAEEARFFEAELLAKRGIAENPVAEGGAARAYWPERALGHGLASWCISAALELTDEASGLAGIRPAYIMFRRNGWFDSAPGTRAVSR